MIYKSLKECVEDLERHGMLVRIRQETDPDLEMAEVQRRLYEAGGPAVLFENVKGSPFPAVSNLFGTIERCRFIFRSTLDSVRKLVDLKADPSLFLKQPWAFGKISGAAINALPWKKRGGPVLYGKTTIDKLPRIKSWPDDGGPFILLPQVYSEDPLNPGVMNSNMGMYRVQLSGNEYETNREIGLHYQIRRDIGIHHSNAIKKGVPLKVSVFVGGPPGHTFSAVMPLPEGLPEVAFAGALSGRRFRYARKNGYAISLDADFCITGTVVPGRTKPEGPFGDHLGYYSLVHDFPYMKVESVYHRKDAIWPFTTVGRPPQEDTSFGELIHEITGPMVPVSLPGLDAVHAVDAAGVHPLLLAIGSERYVPYKKREPQEILTIANAVLGFGHCALAKYLFICAGEDNPDLDIHNVRDYFIHVLERVDFTRDLHFQTRTTIDTLDYSGTGLNTGSKVVIAAAGDKVRKLDATLPAGFSLPEGFADPKMVFAGVVAVRGPEYAEAPGAANDIERLTGFLRPHAERLGAIPLIIIVDDSEFASRNLNNFLWNTFTRSNPSHDIHGVGSFIDHKHWGCTGPLIIDARHKPHHAPPLVENPEVTRRVDELAAKGGPLHGIL